MKVAIFSGTTEGRELCAFMEEAGIDYVAMTATQYGRELSGPRTIAGRLDKAQITVLLEGGGFDAVVDATHPYAAQAHKNIAFAAKAAGVTLLRVRRESLKIENAVHVGSACEAAGWLNTNGLSALITTGSKELEAFTAVSDYAKRLYVRVLPAAEPIQKCIALGFLPSHIAAMQGPFSTALNAAMLDFWDCGALVTKDTGAAGGFAEKADAARDRGAQLVVIDRPDDGGLSVECVERLLLKLR